MDTHKSASPNEARPKKSKNRNNSPSKISAKLIFTSLEALHAKTQAKLRIIRPLSVVMLPVVATKRGFDGQFVTFTTKNCIYPALLVLDKHLKENVSIITESITPEQNLSEGEEVTLCSDCPKVPCLVFIDDLDILCSSRDRNGDTGIVTSLLHLMDGLGTTSDGILVIATASKPQTLDAALRRPGRLSHDVVLSLPDEFARREILQKLLFGVSNDLEESKLTTLAVNAHGYVGGDLQSVVMESVMQTQGRKLTIQDLEASVATTKPAALRESTLSEFEVKLPDICGYDRIKSKLHEALSLTLAHGSVFHKCGITPPSRFLLFGPPGCGKSSIIKALATDFHLRIIPVKRSTVLGKYFGESEQNLARIFLKANDSSPCIIHFENFDGLAGKKKLGEHGGTDVESRIINHLKVQLDGIVQNDGIFIFAETNRPDLLNKKSYLMKICNFLTEQCATDDADDEEELQRTLTTKRMVEAFDMIQLAMQIFIDDDPNRERSSKIDVIRPGRFHEYYFVDLPKPEDRRLILGKHLLPSKVAEAVELDNLIQQTTFFTAAEVVLVHLCEEVKTQSKRESIWNVDDPDYTINSGRCSEEILESLIPNTSQKMLHKYKAFAKIYCS
ncbi:ATPase family protein 2-like [Homarus americanus]|uniref:ATPase family protein 2-like n=1 Tax=Homarus americanus TaxID=6706 RepID=A0A8J5MPF7_HOMAM|nr:ATPase family protein 2-like [Homarus americanus]